MPHAAANKTGQPSAKSLAAVREFNRRNLDLNAHCRSAEVVAQRASLGHPAPALQRSATKAEIRQIALQLDAGALLNPRLWLEAFAVSEDAQRAAA